MSSSPNASNTSELQAAIAINQLLSDNALAAEQAIEHLADITWQIQTAVAKLWEKVTPLPPQEALVLTEIENLVFWKLKGSQTALPMVQAIRLAKGLLQQGGFFNNMQGEGNWLFDEQRRPCIKRPPAPRWPLISAKRASVWPRAMPKWARRTRSPQ